MDERITSGTRRRASHQLQRPISIGMLSTYPPTQCGLATFSLALATHLEDAGAEVGIVRVVEAAEPPAPRVRHQWLPGAATAAARALDGFDVAVVQHEYGIFGGEDGADVLDVLASVHVPVIVVLHTVLTSPTPGQHRVLQAVVDRAAGVVTMTETARRRLLAGWRVDPRRVAVIPHGAEDNRTRPEARTRPPRTVLTWGLLSEGKGIEWALRAMADLGDVAPSPRYRVVGQTHPRVALREGERYRGRLLADVEMLGLCDRVEIDGRYLDGASLRQVVRDADVVLLPYDSDDQVTSGVLTEAVVAGKPVVATRFPHAVDLLSDGAGILVPHRDPAAISAALRRLMTEPGVAAGMAARARALSPSLLWSTVAASYVELCVSLAATTTFTTTAPRPASQRPTTGSVAQSVA